MRLLLSCATNAPGRTHRPALELILASVLILVAHLPLLATVKSVSITTPSLSTNGTTNIASPVHLQVTAESDLDITGYVVYVDGQNVSQNHSPALDAWVILPPGGHHSIYVKAWDSSNASLSTSTFSIYLTGASTVIPPRNATRLGSIDKPMIGSWEVDNNNGVGGECNDGSIGTFTNSSDPNTNNSPDFDKNGQHFTLTSRCTYDDSLFFWKNTGHPQANHTNFLWDFWIYIPDTTPSSKVQALEFDLFQALQMNDGVHEFMFGSQCNYATNQYQFWLPNNGRLTWIDGGISPCRFSSGMWHHLTYFLQRVTTSGYQDIPSTFNSSTDKNSDLRFGTLTIDGNTYYLGGLSNSTRENWSPVFGIQHQLDSAASGITIDEYDDEESVTAW